MAAAHWQEERELLGKVPRQIANSCCAWAPYRGPLFLEPALGETPAVRYGAARTQPPGYRVTRENLEHLHFH